MQYLKVRFDTAVSQSTWLRIAVAAGLSVAVLLPPVRAQQQQPPPGAEARPRRTSTSSGEQQQQPASTTPPAAPKLQTTSSASSTGDDPSQAKEQKGEEVDDDEIYRVESRLVNLNVRVIDRFNRPIDDVRQEDFRVLENGVPQTVEFFSKEEVPIQYGLVIDNSGSLRYQINQVIDAGKTIVRSNKPGDETFLVRFVDSEKIEIKQDFTADRNLLMEALDDLYVEGGATAILDAVYLSAERVAEYKKGSELNDRRRRALILVTDGEDRSSFYNQQQLFALLREEDVQIFVIGFVNELEKESGFIRKSKREKAVELLNRLAKETGGRAFFPSSLKELPEVAAEITRDLRTQYVIGYNPTNKARDGSFRTVRVTIADAPGRDKRIAITRPGYTAPRDGAPPATTKTGTPSKSVDRSTSMKRP